MRPARGRLVSLLAAVAIGLGSCTNLDPETAAALRQEVQTRQAAGEITDGQAAWMQKRIDEAEAGGLSLEEILGGLGAIGVSVVASIFGVQRIRGPAKPMPRTDVAELRALIEEHKRTGGGTTP